MSKSVDGAGLLFGARKPPDRAKEILELEAQSKLNELAEMAEAKQARVNLLRETIQDIGKQIIKDRGKDRYFIKVNQIYFGLNEYQEGPAVAFARAGVDIKTGNKCINEFLTDLSVRTREMDLEGHSLSDLLIG